jgi:hypothetical protein
MSEAEVHALFDRLFPHGFAGQDVLDEIAPQGWEQSPLLACFHPSVEQVFEERLMFHRNAEGWRQLARKRQGQTIEEPPQPTREDVRREYKPSPVNVNEEVAELVGMCLWDVFSDNHEVVAADGRVADIGSFRGASGFLDSYLSRDHDGWKREDYLRFYMGTIGISRRADLIPVYAVIFRRLKAMGADWVYHFPELRIVELPSRDAEPASSAPGYSVSQSAVAEVNAQRRRTEVQRLRAELEEGNARAREAAMDREPHRQKSRDQIAPVHVRPGCMCQSRAERRRHRRVQPCRHFARRNDDSMVGGRFWLSTAFMGRIIRDHLRRERRVLRRLLPDAPNRDCAGAMARVKATLAALGASRP